MLCLDNKASHHNITNLPKHYWKKFSTDSLHKTYSALFLPSKKKKEMVLPMAMLEAHLSEMQKTQMLDDYNFMPVTKACHHVTVIFRSPKLKHIELSSTKHGIKVKWKIYKQQTLLTYTSFNIKIVISYEKSTENPSVLIPVSNQIYYADQPCNHSLIQINAKHFKPLFNLQKSIFKKIKYPTLYGPFPLPGVYLLSHLKKRMKNKKEETLKLHKAINMLSLPQTDDTKRKLHFSHLNKFHLNNIIKESFRLNTPLSGYFSININKENKFINFNVNNFICSLPIDLQKQIASATKLHKAYLSSYLIKFNFLANSNDILKIKQTQDGIFMTWNCRNDDLPISESQAMDSWQFRSITLNCLHHEPLSLLHKPLQYHSIIHKLLDIGEPDNDSHISPHKKLTLPTIACAWKTQGDLRDCLELDKDYNLQFPQPTTIYFHFQDENDYKSTIWHSLQDKQNDFHKVSKLNDIPVTKYRKQSSSIMILNKSSLKKSIKSHKNKNTLLLIQDSKQYETSAPKIFAEVYITDQTKKMQPARGLIDSGADCSLLHITLLQRLFNKKYINKNLIKSNTPLSSFSNHAIKTLGVFNLEIKFNKYHEPQPVQFLIYAGPQIYTLLIGQDLMASFRLTLSFDVRHQPVLSIKKDRVSCFSVSPEQINTASSKINLAPKQSKIVYIKINQGFTCFSHEKVLIEELVTQKLLIPAAISPLLNKSEIAIMAINKTHSPIQKHITLQISAVPASNKLYNKENLPTDSTFKIIRPILDNQPHHNIPCLSINEINRKLPNNHYEFDGSLTAPSFSPNRTYPDTSKDQITSPVKAAEMDQYVEENKSLPNGYEIPDILEISDIVKLDTLPEIVRPFVKRIFIDKYPEVLSRHAYDIGSLSLTLGYCSLKLKKDVTLPPFKKLYYVHNEQRQHLSDVLSFLLKSGIIERANQHHNGQHNLFASPAYLVRKANPHRSGYRLVLDFRYLNDQLVSSPPILPNITQLIENLNDKHIYSTYDLTNAFFSIDLDKESQLLTKFITTEGSFIFKKLTMGLSVSPGLFSTLAFKLVHCVPDLGPNGEYQMEGKNMIKMKEQRLEGVDVFFDDLIISTKYNQSYKRTLQDHFDTTEQLIKRLHTHSARLSWDKAIIAQTKVRFLGWNISNNFLTPDERRIDKLLETPFPLTKKNMRSFLGLLQTLKQVVPGQYLEHARILTPLTSETKEYKPVQAHFDAFEKLKKFLTETPLFCKLINPLAKMYLFTDAATGKGAHYSAVLAQEKSPSKQNIPDYLNVEDPLHDYIHTHNLPYQPLQLYYGENYIAKTKCSPNLFSPIVDISYLYDEKCGFTQDHTNSLMISIKSILYYYKCKFFDEKGFRAECVKHLKSNMNYLQLTEAFSGNHQLTKSFLNDFINSPIGPDENLYLLDSLAHTLKRKIVLITKDKIKYYNDKDKKPPIILGLYITKLGKFFRPFRLNAFDDFDLDSLKDKIEFTYFYSKMIPACDQSKEILSLEALGLIHALDTLRPLIKTANLVCITDSRPLFLLFSKQVQTMHLKIHRYCLKISQEYPDMKLRFIKSAFNLADFLSRYQKQPQTEFKRLPLKYFDLLPEFSSKIKENHEYTIPEWTDLVNKNQHLLSSAQKTLQVNVITGHITHFKHMSYLATILHDKTKIVHIQEEQKLEYNDLFQKCLVSPTSQTDYDKNIIELINGTLFVIQDKNKQILLPTALYGPVICLTHLLHSHPGLKPMLLLTNTYYIKSADSLIRKYLSVCFDCFLNNHTKGPKFGRPPIADYAGEIISLDLMEDLPNIGGYKHILVGICLLTNFIFAYPLRRKTTQQILPHILFHLYQTFAVKKILTDNGPLFKNKLFMDTLTALNIKKIVISPNAPFSNGKGESAIKCLKVKLRKELATQDHVNWVGRLPLIIKAYNMTPNAVLKYSPFQIVFGLQSPNASTYFSPITFPPTSAQISSKELTSQLQEMLKSVRDAKSEMQTQILDRANKNRIQYNYAPGDYVFLKDFKKTIGVTRPLKSRLMADVYVVAQCNFTSLIVKRISDGQKLLVAQKFAKKFDTKFIKQLNIPDYIAPLFSKKFSELTEEDRTLIAKNSTLEIVDLDPTNIILEAGIDSDEDDLEEDENIIDTPVATKQVKFNLPPVRRSSRATTPVNYKI